MASPKTIPHNPLPLTSQNVTPDILLAPSFASIPSMLLSTAETWWNLFLQWPLSLIEKLTQLINFRGLTLVPEGASVSSFGDHLDCWAGVMIFIENLPCEWPSMVLVQGSGHFHWQGDSWTSIRLTEAVPGMHFPLRDPHPFQPLPFYFSYVLFFRTLNSMSVIACGRTQKT